MIGREEITNLRDRLNKELIKKQVLVTSIKEQKELLIKKQDSLAKHKKARIVVQTVSKKIQQKIEFQISKLVSLALSSVFPDPYAFQTSFVERRNRTECDFLFIKNGKVSDDIFFTGGGGAADIATIGIIFAIWSIKKTRPFFLLDEPTKYLHNEDYQERASQLFKRFCDKFNAQVIVISDQDCLIEAADKVFIVHNKKGASFIEEK